MRRARMALWALMTACLALSGCAALDSICSDVSSFGDWPAARKPGSYAFERLPSQQARAAEADALEAAAKAALAKAGFSPVAAGQAPDVLIHVGARLDHTEISPWADPFWRGGFGYRSGPWGGPYWGLGFRLDATRYEREVAVLIRDRASGKPLFEARARNESRVSGMASQTVAAMFEAALLDFPRLGMNPRRVQVALPR